MTRPLLHARITCISNRALIPDLGLDLAKGEVAFILKQESDRSKDLREAKALNLVAVQIIQRVVPMSRPAGPPWLRPKNSTLYHRKKPEAAPAADPPSPAPAIPLDKIEAVVRAVVADELAQQLNTLRDDLLADIEHALKKTVVDTLPDIIGNILREVVPSLIPQQIVGASAVGVQIQPGNGKTKPKRVAREASMFIPTGILSGSKMETENFTVEEEDSAEAVSSSLDNALRRLKNVRKGK